MRVPSTYILGSAKLPLEGSDCRYNAGSKLSRKFRKYNSGMMNEELIYTDKEGK